MNISKEELSGLVERVRGLKGADREVDVLIWLATTEGATRKATTVSSARGLWDPYVIDETRDASGRLIDAPHYTGSVDAALALVERVLPGWKRSLFEKRGGGWVSRISSPRWETYSSGEDTPLPSAPLALLLSLLLSLQSQEPTP